MVGIHGFFLQFQGPYIIYEYENDMTLELYIPLFV